MTAVALNEEIIVLNLPQVQTITGSVTVQGVVFSGTLASSVSVNNFPTNQAIQGTPGGTPIQIWSEGTIGVSGSFAFAPTGALLVGAPAYAPIYVAMSGTLPVAPGDGTVFPVSQQGQISVNNFPATQNVSGTVNVGNLPTNQQMWNAGTVGVSGTVTANVTFPSNQQVWTSGPVGISASTTLLVSQQGQVSVNNFPATQNVSGSVIVGGWGTNVTGTVSVVGGTQVYTSGPQGVSGTVTAVVGNWPATMGVSASAQIPVFSSGPIGVSASTTLPVSQQGQISVNNFPATQNVSGSVTVGSWATNVTASVFIQGAVPQQVWSEGPLGVSGTVTSIVGNWPATLGMSASQQIPVFSSGPVGITASVTLPVQGVSGGTPIQIWSAGTIGVSGNLSVTPSFNNTPQGVSGSQLTGSTFNGYPVVVGGVYPVSGTGQAQGYYVRALGLDPSGSVYVTSTGSIAVAPGDGALFPVSIASTVSVSQQGQVSVNNFPATQNISGTVSSIIGNWPTTVGVSASVQLPVFSSGPVGVTASATLPVSQQGQISVNNFPATQNVSGSVTVGTWGTNVTASVFIQGAAPQQVWSEGALGVSGTVTAIVGNWPATLGVSASQQLPVFSTGPLGVSASSTLPIQGVGGGVPVQIWSAGTLGVSGNLTTTPSFNNTPQGVSGSQLTGSTFNGYPVVVGGVYPVSGTGLPQGYYVRALGLDPSGSVYITSTGSIAVAPGDGVTFPVTIASTVNVSQQGQVSVNNFPAVQAVSGTVTSVIGNWPATLGVSASQQLPVFSTGPVGVSASSTLPVQGAVGGIPLQIWSSGLIGVSGNLTTTPSFNNTPQGVSGSQLTGSTFNGYPVVVGGVYPVSGTGQPQGYYVRALGLDPSGSVYVTSTGSIAVAPGDGATFPVSIAAVVNVSQQGQVSVNNFPATQAVSGTVTSIIGNWPASLGISASVQLPIFSTGPVGVTASATLPVSQQGQISVNNFPATQNVSGTVTVQGGAAGTVAPVQIWSSGLIGVSGTLSTTPSFNNTPVGVSGSQLTGSTFNGYPVVIGGVYPVSATGLAQPYYVRAMGVDPSGSVYVTSTGSLAVAPGDGAVFPVTVQGQIGVDNFPATQNVSGTVTSIIGNWPATHGISASVQLPVFSTGPIGVTASLPIQVWSEGVIGVSGTVSISVTGSTGLFVTSPIYAPQPILVSSNSVGVSVLQGSAAKTGDGALEVSQSPNAQAAYAFSTGLFQVVGSPTDVFVIQGSATKTVKVHSMQITAQNTKAELFLFNLLVRTTGDSGGTSGSITAASFDQNDPVATAKAYSYTANPTSLGNQAGGLIRSDAVPGISGTNPSSALLANWTFGRPPFSKPITLRGISQQLCLNLSGSSGDAFDKISVDVEFTEES